MAGKNTCVWLALLLSALPACAAAQSLSDDEYSFPVAAPPGLERCQTHWREVHAKQPGPTGTLEREFFQYQEMVEQALVYRARTIEWGKRLRAKQGPLSGADLQLLNEGMADHLALRERLMNVAENHECWVDPSNKIENSLTPRQRLEGVMLSLSAALVLYDNYLLAVSLFEEDERLRRVLNDSDSGYGIGREMLTRIALSYNSIQNRARVRSAITYYETQSRKLTPGKDQEARMRYLTGIIEQSPSYDMTKAVSPAYVVGRKLRFMEQLTRDRLSELADGGVGLFSMLFGNTVGLVETRKGKLYGRSEIQAKVIERLRPGDILLEKTPFRLTDALIPGYWGHVALWVGTENELRQMGLWDHPLVAPHHEAIRSGAGVLEALRSGVELNPLHRFLNIDDLAVLRMREMDAPSRTTVVLNALRQFGKEYDFNFDVETTDRIVCSELVYAAHTEIEWPTMKTLGRSTISPDQVAAKAMPGGPLELVLLYEDGREISEQRDTRLVQLLKQPDTAVLSLNLGSSPRNR